MSASMKSKRTALLGGQQQQQQQQEQGGEAAVFADEQFEFAAPKFVDFSKEEALNQTGKSEAWFDTHLSSPLTGPTRVARPAALLSQLGREDDDFDFDVATPKASKHHPKTTSAYMQPTKASNARNTENGLTKKLSLMALSNNNSLGEKRPATALTAKRQPLAQQRQRPATASSTTVPARQRLTTTIPKEFNFAKRSTTTAASSSSTNKLGINKSSSIQKRPLPKKATGELTVPKPFHFHQSVHRPTASSSAPLQAKSPFVPLVNRVKMFETQVPDRFKPVPKATTHAPHLAPRLTKPHSPNLLTKNRMKSTPALKSTEQLEIESLTEYPKFKAHPVNKKILKEPAHIPAPIHKPPTIPMTPNLSKPRRASAPVIPSNLAQNAIPKANPIPRSLHAKPFEPVLTRRQIVPRAHVVLPGEEVSARKLREFEEAERRRCEEEERVREFRARGVPDLNASNLPFVPPKPTTAPAPFHFTAHPPPRSAFSQQDLLAPKFTAQPVPLVDPFVPKRSDKPVTVPEEVALRTDWRAEERRAFEEAKREREREEEVLKEQARVEREEFERQQIKQLRQDQTFVAQPIRTFPGFQIHASDRKLTEPASPMFKDKRERVARLQGQARVAVAAEGRSLWGLREVPGEDEEEEEEEVPMGEFEVQEGDGGAGVKKREWAAPVEWVDSDGVAGSGGF
ncbi:Protein tpx2 [Podochytrium sp. JEL0797]|nr:Protein tpx2 [Podochytrium sp. JEL0797]